MSTSTPEGRVKRIIREKLMATPNLYYFMPAANGFGRAGIPDFIGALPNGKFFAIEAKADKGRVTALQQRELTEITTAHGIALIIRGEQEARALDIQELLKI